MIEYIIKKTHTWQNSKGETITMISFLAGGSKLYNIKTFTSRSQDAMKFDNKTEALNYIKNNFTNNKTVQYSVKAIELPVKVIA